jgi:hypothetical protein
MGRLTRGGFVVSALLLSLAPQLAAQSTGGDSENAFLLTGFGFSTFTTGNDNGDGSFNLGFTPIFLYKVSDRFLFEAEVEIEYEDQTTEVGLEYAQVDWLIGDGATLVMGKFLTPFGQFIERRHAAWINKVPTMPLIYMHGQSLVPFSQIGAQLRGGIGLGGSGRFGYSLMVSNGFAVSEHGHGDEEGEEHEEEEGDEHGEEGGEHGEEGDDHQEEGEHADPVLLDAASSSNGDLAYGGRVSVIPVSGLEFGVSYLSGTYDPEGHLEATMAGLDLSYHHEMFDIVGEWVDTETALEAHEGEAPPDQQVEGWYFQPSLRLAVIPAYFLNSVEAVVRIGEIDYQHRDVSQLAVGFNYYFNGSTIIRLAWEQLDPSDGLKDDAVTLMFAMGF